MIVGTQHPSVLSLRPALEEAILARLIACGEHEPYSPEWEEAYFEASKPVFTVKDQMREVLWQEYLRLWGKNATGYYFLPANLLNREERMATHRVGQKLALAHKELVE